MPCADSLRVQAYFDGEIDAVSAAEVERHVAHCAECRAQLDELARARTALRQGVRREHAPAELRAHVIRALDEEGRRPAPRPAAPRVRVRRRASSFWAGAASGVGASAVAAALAFTLLSPPAYEPLVDDMVDAHVRSLMPAHLIDVASSDRHTVKPWFAGQTDVSPVVVDFEPQGYRLVGGRADYLDRQRSAVVVYRHGAHVINVFSWAEAGRALPPKASRNGYRVACWTAGDLGYCAVSDTGWDELEGLVRLLRDAVAHESEADGSG